MNDNQQDRLMTIADLAWTLGIPVDSLYRWRHQGLGPRGYRVGRHVRYQRRTVEAWLWFAASGQRCRPTDTSPAYTRPLIPDHVFNPNRHDCLTGDQLRVLDFAVDIYNDHIVNRVTERAEAGVPGKRWAVLAIAGILDRLAYRRYLIDEEAAPEWWTPYDLPEAYLKISPRPDTRFFRSDRFGRIEGGLFSLDGVHPTTIGYALISREAMNLMTEMGVPLGATEPDFDDVPGKDTLMRHPPENLATLMTAVAFGDCVADLLRSVYYAAKNRPTCDRVIKDAQLLTLIRRVHADNYGVYGAPQSVAITAPARDRRRPLHGGAANVGRRAIRRGPRRDFTYVATWAGFDMWRSASTCSPG